MRKIVFIVCLLVISIWSAQSFGTPITIINHGDTWDYYQIPPPELDLWPVWSSITHTTFDWDNPGRTWTTGNAVFGNGGAWATYWNADTDLALKKNVYLSTPLNGSVDVTLNAALDNGFVVFVNGIKVAHENAEGGAAYWEYTLSVDSSLFDLGANKIEVLAEDHGGGTFFDMQMIAETAFTLANPLPDTGPDTVLHGYLR